MDVQTRLRELKVGPVRAQVEGRDGDRYFVVSGEELLLLDPDVVQRVVLRDITKISSDNSGTLRVFAGDRVAIATPSRNFRSQLLKEFFIGVKNAVGHARLTSSAFNLPAIGSSGVDLPAVPLQSSLPQSLEEPVFEPSRPYTSAATQTPTLQTPAPTLSSVPPSTPGPGYAVEASAPHPVPSSDVTTSSSVSVAGEPDAVIPIHQPDPLPAHPPAITPTFTEVRTAATPLRFEQPAPLEQPVPEYPSEFSDELAPVPHFPPVPVPRSQAAPVAQAAPVNSSPVIAINTAPPVEQTLGVSVPLSSSEGLRRLQLQIDSRVQSVRLMAIVSGIFGILAGALLLSTSAIAALCLMVLGAACAAGLYFTAEMFANLSRGLGEL